MSTVHSARSASMGSVRAARRAGIQLASTATRMRTSDTTTSVTGSLGATPYSRDRMKCATRAKSTSPAAMPARVRASPPGDHSANHIRRGTERDAHAKFPRPQTHDVGNHAVKADAAEEQADDRGHANDQHGEGQARQ